MSTNNICFCGEIKKYLPDTHSYLDLWSIPLKLSNVKIIHVQSGSNPQITFCVSLRIPENAFPSVMTR